ncbi:hypothetical protein J2T19_002399 [Paenibacillus tundrae]|uniref:Uncharacterized protein n=1 Tax=Paenibacillus tundrae TaxID=528187 RepID=A0ABT9WCG8_9BACL|nr:hypothetical protein [Paenibacillus tundrae]
MMRPHLFSLQCVEAMTPSSFITNNMHGWTISLHHDVAELFQFIVLYNDIFNNLQRLQPASAGLFTLNGEMAMWRAGEQLFMNDEIQQMAVYVVVRSEVLRLTHDMGSPFMHTLIIKPPL